MQNFQELRFADLAQRLLRDVTRLVRPTRDARQVLLATPPNDPNQLGLAILELLLFTEGVNCLTLGAGVPAQEIAGAADAYKTSLVVLLFDRGISGKIAGQEIRSLRAELPHGTPLVVSGRAVNLLAKPIADVQTAADFSSIMAMMRELGVTSPTPPQLPVAASAAVVGRDAQHVAGESGAGVIFAREPLHRIHPTRPAGTRRDRVHAGRVAHRRARRRPRCSPTRCGAATRIPICLLELSAFRLC